MASSSVYLQGIIPGNLNSYTILLNLTILSSVMTYSGIAIVFICFRMRHPNAPRPFRSPLVLLMIIILDSVFINYIFIGYFWRGHSSASIYSHHNRANYNFWSISSHSYCISFENYDLRGLLHFPRSIASFAH